MIILERVQSSAALERLDGEAARLVTRAAPLRFAVAQSPATLEAAHRLRYQVVIEKGWAAPDAFPDGLERDGYDDRAIQIVAWEGQLPAGTIRLVLPVTGYGLPTEDVFGLKIEPPGEVVDTGRMCVARSHRDAPHRVLWGLLAQTWIEMRSRGFSMSCGIQTASLTRLYQRLGFQVIILGDPRSYWGERRFPILIQPERSSSSLKTPHLTEQYACCRS